MKHQISPHYDYKKSDDIHGTVIYPAPMIAPFQKEILTDCLVSLEKECISAKVLDPFYGSGTALYEAATISSKITVHGTDINPLAKLITRVKLEGVSDRIERDIELFQKKVKKSGTINLHSFSNIEKWFRADIIVSLSTLRSAICSTKNTQNRRFFWYMFIDIVRKYCNSRTSTYKLHMKNADSVANIDNNVISDYLNKMRSEYEYFTNIHIIKPDIYKREAVEYLRANEDNAFDICMTSPPYGDNGTTVPYGQYSMLALLWIDPYDLDLFGWELLNYSAIDGRSMGGFSNKNSTSNQFVAQIEPVLNDIRKDKQLKVKRFLNGYYSFLDEVSRVTKDTIITTLGNRTVDGKIINLVDLTRKHLLSCGIWSCTDTVERRIPTKRMPRMVSSVGSGPVSSMNEEYVLIFKKEQARRLWSAKTEILT